LQKRGRKMSTGGENSDEDAVRRKRNRQIEGNRSTKTEKKQTHSRKSTTIVRCQTLHGIMERERTDAIMAKQELSSWEEGEDCTRLRHNLQGGRKDATNKTLKKRRTEGRTIEGTKEQFFC